MATLDDDSLNTLMKSIAQSLFEIEKLLGAKESVPKDTLEIVAAQVGYLDLTEYELIDFWLELGLDNGEQIETNSLDYTVGVNAKSLMKKVLKATASNDKAFKILTNYIETEKGIKVEATKDTLRKEFKIRVEYPPDYDTTVYTKSV